MGISSIQWTHYTFNLWRGCSKVSPGCDNCYAETMSRRNPKVFGEWGPDGKRVIAAESYWRFPLKWDREAKDAGVRRRVFCASLADVFEDRPELAAPRKRVWDLIGKTASLDWLLLTKRPENWRKCWPLENVPGHVRQNEGDGKRWKHFPNLWLGVSVEDQQRADERIPLLLQTPAAVRFLSCEPMLGPVDLTQLWLADKSGWWNALDGRLTCKARSNEGQEFWCETEKPIRPRVDWVICGGESGHGARPCRLEWVRSLVEQCKAAGVPCFVKQLGADPVGADYADGKMALGTLLLNDPKGGDISEFPDDLKVREFPNAPQQEQAKP